MDRTTTHERKAMPVETYEIEEIASNQDDCAETQALIESLNLEGQKALVSKVGINPYRKMTDEEDAVYRALLPQTTKVEEYASGSIPLRVLQVLAHASSLDFFDRFEVWHPQDVRKDPLLVGCKSDPIHTWNTQRYMLARWGEVLENFDALRTKAAEMIRAKLKADAAESKSKVEAVLATIAEWPAEKLFRHRTGMVF